MAEKPAPPPSRTTPEPSVLAGSGAPRAALRPGSSEHASGSEGTEAGDAPPDCPTALDLFAALHRERHDSVVAHVVEGLARGGAPLVPLRRAVGDAFALTSLLDEHRRALASAGDDAAALCAAQRKLAASCAADREAHPAWQEIYLLARRCFEEGALEVCVPWPARLAAVLEIGASMAHHGATLASRRYAEHAARLPPIAMAALPGVEGGPEGRRLRELSSRLCSPLTVVLGFAELLGEAASGALTTRQAEYATDVLTAARQIQKLLDDALDAATVREGQGDDGAAMVDVAALVAQACNVHRASAFARGIEIRANVSDDVRRLKLSPLRLRQVLFHYLSNAVKFGAEGGKVEVRARSGGRGALLLLEVEDDGPGIDCARLPHVFDEIAPAGEGGLGLRLTKRAVEAQSGTVGVRSTRGRGTTFWARIPVERPRERARGASGEGEGSQAPEAPTTQRRPRSKR